MLYTEEPETVIKGDPRQMLGSFIRMQRQMANLSLRQLSALTEISNPYLSQVERGLHEPSIRVLKSIADALNVSTANSAKPSATRCSASTAVTSRPTATNPERVR